MNNTNIYIYTYKELLAVRAAPHHMARDARQKIAPRKNENENKQIYIYVCIYE